MESAIPAHLLRQRTRFGRAGIQPNSNGVAVVPRFDAAISKVTVAYLGLQLPQDPDAAEASQAQDWLQHALGSKDGAGHFERSRFVDATGCVNLLFACYWAEDQFDAWWTRIGSRWTRDAAWLTGVGRFAEILDPSIDRLEAITDGLVLHGLSSLARKTSAPVREQGYWGAMRDRIPLSQTDALLPEGSFLRAEIGSLVVVQAPSNLCVINTGQDWSLGEETERRDYRDLIEPTMQSSMDVLNRSGAAFGCLCSRYAWLLDETGKTKEATYGMSIWRSLSHLERWAEGHYTHLTSYVKSVQHGTRHGAAAKLSRYHEVVVPTEQQVRLEYRNCHPRTGVLGIS